MKGAPKPDISTTEAFKRTLLNATSIGYAEQSASSIYLNGLFVRLGIADEIKAKIKLFPGDAADHQHLLLYCYAFLASICQPLASLQQPDGDRR